MAGSCGWVSVSAETVSGLKAILGGLSLGRGIPFPRCRSILDEEDPANGGNDARAGSSIGHEPSSVRLLRARVRLPRDRRRIASD
jgi:hypothetical protein